MLAYGAFGSCACACQYSPNTIPSAKAPNAIILTIFWFIDSSLEFRRSYILEYSAMLLRKSKSPASQAGLGKLPVGNATFHTTDYNCSPRHSAAFQLT